MWILDAIPDVLSDFSVFHRIEDPLQLPSPRFFQLAERLPAYQGACQAKALAQQARQRREQETEHLAYQAPVQHRAVAPAGYERFAKDGVSQVDDLSVLSAMVPDLIDYKEE